MRISKTLTLLSLIPVLLTGCAKKVSKDEALAHVDKYYTETSKINGTLTAVSVLKASENLPSAFSGRFASEETIYTVQADPFKRSTLEECDESKYEFYIDGKCLEYKFAYKDDDVKAYVEKVIGEKFPSDYKFVGDATGSCLINDKGYVVKVEQILNFQVRYKIDQSDCIGKLSYTANTSVVY